MKDNKDTFLVSKKVNKKTVVLEVNICSADLISPIRQALVEQIAKAVEQGLDIDFIRFILPTEILGIRVLTNED